MFRYAQDTKEPYFKLFWCCCCIIFRRNISFSSQVYVILASSHWQKQSSSTHWLKLPPSQVSFAHYMLYFCSFRCCIPVHTDVACMVPAKLHSDLNNTLLQSIITYSLSPQTPLTPFEYFPALLVCVFQHILSMSFLVFISVTLVYGNIGC